MRLMIRLSAVLSLIALTAGWNRPAQAQEMVSIDGDIVNMRSGPSLADDILWELERGYPLQVLDRKDGWLQVRDFENDTGWVSSQYTGQTPHHIVKSRIANIRTGPSTRSKIVGKAEKLETLRTLSKEGSWVKVERRNGQTGWVAGYLLWGW